MKQLEVEEAYDSASGEKNAPVWKGVGGTGGGLILELPVNFFFVFPAGVWAGIVFGSVDRRWRTFLQVFLGCNLNRRFSSCNDICDSFTNKKKNSMMAHIEI